MDRIYLASSGPCEWRRFLGDPDRHWKRGRSALETAVSWEAAARTPRGLPAEIADALDNCEELSGAQLLIAIPEHKVALKGRGGASQNDVWALLKTSTGLVSMTIEAKAGEPFDKTVEDWMADRGAGKVERLNDLCSILGLERAEPKHRYQLFHRAASAIIEAKRFGAQHAVMMIQSFAKYSTAWDDYLAFTNALNASVTKGQLCNCAGRSEPRLLVGWVDCMPASDQVIAELL